MAAGDIGLTNYQHPFPNYQLNDLHQAMDYNSMGQPIVRVSTSPGTGTGTQSSNTDTQSDAFGRLRISESYTVFDSQNRYLDGQQFASKTTGTASVTYNQAGSNFSLTVGTASGDEVIRQSRTTQLYQPGKSLLSLNTFAFSALQTNLRQRVGYFTADNGVYFEADGNSLSFVVRSRVSGSVVENRILQSNWNRDALNGTGPSQLTLDPTKVQIWWCDIEWLGVGSIRVGFVINGIFRLAHVFNHANLISNVYMTTAILNPRYEIRNTGVTTGATMLQICSTVISEGGYQPTPQIAYVSNNTTVTRVTPATTLTPLVALRLNPSYPDAVVVPSQLELLCIDVRYGEYQLVLNPTLTGITWNNISGSTLQYATGLTTMTGGVTVFGGLISSRSVTELTQEVKKTLQFSRDVDGVTDVLCFAAAFTSANTDLLYKFGWQELSN